MNVLGLINARGGSQGVPRKNVRSINGKPLIAYAIEAGRASIRISDVVVSTDDTEIAEVARAHGAETPFLRPSDLGTSTALQIDVILHAIRTLRAMNREYDYVAVLQPTAPLRTSADIDGALELLIDSGCDSVATFSPVPHHHPYYMYQIENERPASFIDVPANLQRQDFPQAFIRNGAVYAARRQWLEHSCKVFGGNFRAYIMPAERSVNIDTPLDWRIAELLLQERGVV